MPVVHGGGLLEETEDLTEQDLARRLNAQILVDVVDVVADELRTVDIRMYKNIQEIRAERVQDELLHRLVAVVVRRILLIRLIRDLAETHGAQTRHTAYQCLREETILRLLHEGKII